MKILIAVPNIYGTGGIQNYARSMINDFKRLGHSIHVIDLFSQNTDGHSVAPTDLLCPRSFLGKCLHGRMWEKRFAAHIRGLQQSYDIAIAAHTCCMPATSRYAAAHKIPWSGITYGIEAWGRISARHTAAICEAPRVVAISNFTMKRLQEQHGRTAPIDIIPPCVDTSSFSPHQGTAPNRKNRILTVARLDKNERYKGHDLVLEALPSLIDALDGNIDYHIVGSGNDLPRIKGLVTAHGLDEHVIFEDKAADDDLAGIYRSADIFVMPSFASVRANGTWTGEGFGIAYLEAAACAKPSIAANVGGQTDAIIDGETGLLVPPDSKKIASAVKDLLLNRERMQKMGMAARKHVEEHFSSDNSQNRWKRFVTNLTTATLTE